MNRECGYPGCESTDTDIFTVENSETGETKQAWLCPKHDKREA